MSDELWLMAYAVERGLMPRERFYEAVRDMLKPGPLQQELRDIYSPRRYPHDSARECFAAGCGTCAPQ